MYVDAATQDPTKGRRVAVVIDSDHHEITSGSLRDSTVTEAEELAVALAAAEGFRTGRSLTILSDSQEACRHFMNGRVSHRTLRVLLEAKASVQDHPEHPPTFQHKILWVPAHAGITGNIEADRVARGYATNRAPEDPDLEEPTRQSPRNTRPHWHIIEAPERSTLRHTNP